MNVERANDLLRYAIGVLRGGKMVSLPSGRVHVALIFKDRLEEAGFWWQAQILNFWINRFYSSERADLSKRGERASSFVMKDAKTE